MTSINQALSTKEPETGDDYFLSQMKMYLKEIPNGCEKEKMKISLLQQVLDFVHMQ